MKRFRLIGLCLVAVFAMGAVVASTAVAAEPTFVAKSGTLPMTGNITVGPGRLLVPAIGVEIACTEGSGSGEIFNDEMSVASFRKATVTFKKCTFTESGISGCTINGKANGEFEIVATEIQGMLGYAPGKANNKEFVRVELESANASGVFTTIEFSGSGCALKNEKIKITKGVIAEVPPPDIDTTISEATLELKATSSDEQELKEIELPLLEPKLHKLELLYGSHPAAISGKATLKLTGTNQIEIKV